LLKKIFEVAKSEKCKRVRWQVLNWNHPAIEFYKKSGATIDDEWSNCDFDKKGVAEFKI
jgi:RimJ/RimL family protein N-acetyltransferase